MDYLSLPLHYTSLPRPTDMELQSPQRIRTRRRALRDETANNLDKKANKKVKTHHRRIEARNLLDGPPAASEPEAVEASAAANGTIEIVTAPLLPSGNPRVQPSSTESATPSSVGGALNLAIPPPPPPHGKGPQAALIGKILPATILLLAVGQMSPRKKAMTMGRESLILMPSCLWFFLMLILSRNTIVETT